MSCWQLSWLDPSPGSICSVADRPFTRPLFFHTNALSCFHSTLNSLSIISILHVLCPWPTRSSFIPLYPCIPFFSLLYCAAKLVATLYPVDSFFFAPSVHFCSFLTRFVLCWAEILYFGGWSSLLNYFFCQWKVCTEFLECRETRFRVRGSMCVCLQ